MGCFSDQHFYRALERGFRDGGLTVEVRSLRVSPLQVSARTMPVVGRLDSVCHGGRCTGRVLLLGGIVCPNGGTRVKRRRSRRRITPGLAFPRKETPPILSTTPQIWTCVCPYSPLTAVSNRHFPGPPPREFSPRLPRLHQRCAVVCADEQFAFMGLQNGKECWCGSSGNEARHTQHGEGACDTPCAGDSSEICGAFIALTSSAF